MSIVSGELQELELSSPATQQKKRPTCGYCGRRLGYGYYLTCRECGATFCYIHMDRHRHEKSEETLMH
ncbi:MAG: hypothetical protein FJ358_07890 [Thaumarchaeota archaeon]|nr:hypothetical protein [Nitrososphaerota archaeon]